MDGSVARRMWRVFEPVHDVVYFSPEPRAAADALGLRGFWMGYFAFRAAPLGPVGPAPVAAACYGFHPDRVARALPDAWTHATPEQALDARARGCADALRRIWTSVPARTTAVATAAVAPAAAAGPDTATVRTTADPDTADRIVEAADLAWTAAQATDVPGRVLGAANRAVPRPDDPVQALWQATTTLREHRGDGHVAVLVARGISGLHAHLLKTSAGESDPEMLRESRRFSVEEWTAGGDELQARGLVDGAGQLTAAGTAERDAIERTTDDAATGPWAALGSARTDRLFELLEPLAAAVLDSGDLPPSNPVGLGPR